MPDAKKISKVSMDTIVSLAKRRGFVFPGSEIYGGLANSWDYGPLGIELKNNLKNAWWNFMTREHDNIVGLDAAILMHPDVWAASGHVEGFTDPLQECEACHRRFRSDEIAGDTDEEFVKKCPTCAGLLTDPKNFHLMLETHLGPVKDTGHKVYLRPETAQGIFLDAELIWTAMRLKPPFGIAQIGKSFRNEITPGNFIYRMREFEQMEMQYFIRPEKFVKEKGEKPEEIFESWKQQRMDWYTELGVDKKHLQFKDHAPDERAHYAELATDIQYEFPFGWSELEGIHYRTDFDLKSHSEKSGKDLSYIDQVTKEKFIPHVVETAVGVDRSFLTFLLDAYTEETDDKGEVRTVLKFDPRLAPVKVAILPLSKKPELSEQARELRGDLAKHMNVQYDESGSIGRRYRRQDEIGTPLCVTVDFESKDDGKVTVRDRDTMKQDRVAKEELNAFVLNKINGQA